MANEKLTPTQITKTIRDIEAAHIGETKALKQFTQADGSVSIPATLSDGNGLFLIRHNNGSWRWIYRFSILGKKSNMALGKHPDTTLAEAREKHKEAKKLARDGINPSAHKKEQKHEAQLKSTQTFKQIADAWFNNWRRGDVSKRYAETTWRRLEKDVFPKIGDLSIHSLDMSKISPPIEDVAKRAPVVADKIWISCRKIFAYACIKGIIKQNPFVHAQRVDLLAAKHTTINQPRVSPDEFPQLLKDIDNYSHKLPRIGLQLMALVFVRHGELRFATWDEFDFEKKLWIIPAARMKMSTPHVVPLAKQTIVLLKKLKDINGHHAHLFPSTKGEGKVMSDGTLNKALNTLGYKGRQTVHGFRGNASTILHELGYEHSHIELQLAHMPRNKSSAPYNHATYLTQRTKMMQDWADYLDKLRLES